MNVLLVNPEWSVKNKSNLWRKVASKYPSLGLAYIASVLEKEGHNVMYAEMSDFYDSAWDNHWDSLDYVGITATTPLISKALELAELFKKHFGATIVLGGVHPTINDEEVIGNDFVDVVVRGEGEITMKEIVNGVPLSEIDGVTYVKKGLLYRTPDRKVIKDLDELPVPAYHLMPMETYRPAVGAYSRLPAMSIFATRGCPGRCTFCCRLFEGRIRVKSARKIVDEIKLLQQQYGIREVSFYDDTFTATKKNVREFCKIIKEEGIDISWSCFTRVNYIDEELFTLMYEAGCHLVLFGVESGNQKILDGMNKMITLQQVRNAVAVCKRIGLHTRASYIFGCVGDTEETIKQTIDFALELDTDYAQFNIMTAYPGTALWEQAKKAKWLCVPVDYDYSVSDFSMELPTISNERLMYYYKLAHRKYYLRPRMLWRQLCSIHSWEDVQQKVRGGLAVLLQA